jgi:phenylpyruvate tautomerase PptA (4-oxalocrotonate tautomerase family)
MPINVVATEGVLDPAAETQLFADLTDAFLKNHDLLGNSFLTPNVIGEIKTIPKGKSFAGGKPADIVIVELKVPSFALDSAEQKRSFIAEATDIVMRSSGGKLHRDRIFVNMVYAVDGLWGIGGKAFTNADLGAAVQAAAAS